jgi:uncharacterized protein YkwD
VRSRFLIPFVLAVLITALVAPAQAAGSGQLQRSVLDEVNRVRAAYRLAPLRPDPVLERAAQSHSVDMLRRGYFGHGAFAQRLSRFGARGPRLGENLAWGTGSAGDVRYIVQRWLASPPHRANLLRPGFRRIGIGAVVGTFSGYDSARVVTADFAGS